MRFYARYYVSIEGKLDGEAESVDVKYNGDPMPISTLVQDLAGFYIPPKNATVSIKGFIPASGDRVDYVGYFLANSIVSVKVIVPPQLKVTVPPPASASAGRATCWGRFAAELTCSTV